MPTYVLLTKFNSDAIIEPQEMAQLTKMVQKRVNMECPDVDWTSSYVLLGRYDALDIFSAPNNETASKVAVIIRSFGHATTEILPATQWDIFSQMVRDLDHSESERKNSAESGENLNQGVAPDEKVGIGGNMADHNEAEESIEDKVDEAMVESFPASDPPSYNPQ